MTKKKIQPIASSIDSIDYEGSVKLKLTKGKQVLKTYSIKNTGTYKLFESIASALTGSLNLVPKFIGIGAKAGDTELTADCLNEEITRVYIYTTKTIEYKDIDGDYAGHIALFVATVPYTSINAMTIYEIGLFGDEKTSTMLARIPVDNGISISQGMSLTIEWSIKIQNKKVVKTTDTTTTE